MGLTNIQQSVASVLLGLGFCEVRHLSLCPRFVCLFIYLFIILFYFSLERVRGWGSGAEGERILRERQRERERERERITPSVEPDPVGLDPLTSGS